MQDVYEKSLFYNYQPNLKAQKCPFGVLVGYVGTGKTTVFNLLTNKQMETSDGGETVTRSVFISPSGFGDQFQIIDTPGTFADQDKINLATNLRMALIEKPLSRIFLFLKFERYGAMIKNLEEQLLALKEWKILITIVVTFWDRDITQNSKQQYFEIKKKLLENNKITDSFIFIGINANPKSACKAFYQNMCICQPTQLEISDTQFQYYFDLYDNFDNHVKSFVSSIREIQQTICEEITNYNDQDKDEFMHACIVVISQIAEQMIEEFIQKHFSSMEEIDSYIYYMKLKQAFIPLVDKVRKLASERMSYSLFDKRDAKNMFKACPYCQIIWANVDGCDGQAICGYRLKGNDYLLNQAISVHKFKFSWVNNNFKWIKETMDHCQPNCQNEVNQNLGVKGIGCGRSFIWRDQPQIQDSILNNLKEAGITDFCVNHPEQKCNQFKEMLEEYKKKVKINYLY